jgi:nicotinate-nucleotide adenylyltransferase
LPRPALNLGLHLTRGMKVGLYGGSFNPAHQGHRHVSDEARKRLGLDKVIWLVSPQNPTKREPTQPLADRMAKARALAGRGTVVSDAETRLGIAYTVDTIKALKARYRGVRFVWIMGADNLASFHLWRGWKAIARMVPIAVAPRPGFHAQVRFSPLARRFGHARLPMGSGPILARTKAPAWLDLGGPLNPMSSSALRAATRPPG